MERLHDGLVLYRPRERAEQIVSPQTAWLVSDMLDDDAARVPAFGERNPLEVSRPMAVKTGTTNDYRDNLTVGWTPWLAVGVWTGNKDGRPMRNVLGITGAAPIWHDTVEAVFADRRLMRLLGDGELPPPGFPIPAGVTRSEVCSLSGLLGGAGCRPRSEAFAAHGPTRDDQHTVGYFARDGACDSRVSGPGQGTLALLAPEHPRVAEEVRRWWRGSPPVAAPPCRAGSAAHSPARGRDRASLQSSRPGR